MAEEQSEPEFSDEEREQIRQRLEELGDDPTASKSRLAACDSMASALRRIGEILWVGGYLIGPDRVSDASPFGFGDDRAVGVATVAQIGGELGSGAVELLRAGNDYAAAALIRQLVEVEYLAHAFAADHDVAADWLRADQDERLTFWSPQKLRNRAGGQFLNEDYWRHCERGGHPTTEGMGLLPGHSRNLSQAYFWVDLAGHLSQIWKYVLQGAERFAESSVRSEWELPDVDSAIRAWRSTDGLYAALQDLGDIMNPRPGSDKR